MPVMMHTGYGRIIRDADALPGDVYSGKVFYNGDGRQVGTNEFNIKSILISNPELTSSSTTLTLNGVIIGCQVDININRVTPIQNKIGEFIGNVKYITTLDSDVIIGIKVNGHYFNFGSCGYDYAFTIYNSDRSICTIGYLNGLKRIGIGIINENLFKNLIIEIFYTESRGA